MRFSPPIPAPIRRVSAFVAEAVGRFLRTDCPTRAAGLTLYSFLAIVPILCCVLVMAKVCGVDRYARAQIDRHIDEAIVRVECGQASLPSFLAPVVGEDPERKALAAEEFAAEARKITDEVFRRIGRFDIGTFGWIGFAFLLWTVVSSLSVVEECFNRIWGALRPRPLGRRILLYLGLLVILPVLASVAFSLPILGAVKSLVVATAGATAWTRSASDFVVFALDTRAFRMTVTLLAASTVFGFFYWILPNRPVRFVHAWAGGLAAVVMLGVWMRICAVAQVGIVRSSVLYGGFAFLPIVLAWQHVSWQIILFAACLVRTLGASHGESPS